MGSSYSPHLQPQDNGGERNLPAQNLMTIVSRLQKVSQKSFCKTWFRVQYPIQDESGNHRVLQIDRGGFETTTRADSFGKER
ncbi:hypothetical protein Tco_0899383 [Tanacetum coccineum]